MYNVCIYIYIYINYVYWEKERERERRREIARYTGLRLTSCKGPFIGFTFAWMYIYIEVDAHLHECR